MEIISEDSIHIDYIQNSKHVTLLTQELENSKIRIANLEKEVKKNIERISSNTKATVKHKNVIEKLIKNNKISILDMFLIILYGCLCYGESSLRFL